MSLREIVRALGGDLYQNGHRANVPAPGHSPADRSVSLVMSEGRVIVHSFGGADWREVLDDLRRRGLVDRRARPCGVASTASAAPRPDERRRIQTARALWAAGVQTGSGGLVARHLARRGLTWMADLRGLSEHPAAPLWIYGPGTPTRRAMMACISAPDGATTAVELTYLDPNGLQAVDVAVSRKTVGRVPGGSAVRLSLASEIMLVGEGVVTTLSAMMQFHRPGWALLSAGNLACWRAPDGVREVLIAADRGAAGEAAAYALRDRLKADGLVAAIAWPWEPFGDWNEVLTAVGAERREEGRPGAPVRRGWASPPAGDLP